MNGSDILYEGFSVKLDVKSKDLFNELMKPWNTFLNDTPLKGFLQSIDELFNKSFQL